MDRIKCERILRCRMLICLSTTKDWVRGQNHSCNRQPPSPDTGRSRGRLRRCRLYGGCRRSYRVPRYAIDLGGCGGLLLNTSALLAPDCNIETISMSPISFICRGRNYSGKRSILCFVQIFSAKKKPPGGGLFTERRLEVRRRETSSPSG
jgi:hypothetical protein